MPTKSFKVNIYEVGRVPADDGPETEFDQAVRAVCGLELGERERNIGGKFRRIESWDAVGEVLLVNFVSLEYAGPGRALRGQPVQAIALRNNESFAPETAMLYDPDSRLAFLESLRGGVTPGIVARYFQHFTPERADYFLTPRADHDAAARARRHQTIRNVEMRVSLGRITERDRAAGLGVIEGLGEGYGASVIDIIIKSERRRGRSLPTDRIRRLFAGLLNDNNEVSPAVEKFRVSGKEADDDPMELIDLIQHREHREFELEIDAVARRVPHRTRWDALLAARRNFV